MKLDELHRAVSTQTTPASLDAKVLAAVSRIAAPPEGRDSGPLANGSNDALADLHHRVSIQTTPASLDASIGEEVLDDPLAVLHRKVSTDQVPADLDASVIAAVLAASEASRFSKRHHFQRRIAAPLAIAAAVVLVASAAFLHGGTNGVIDPPAPTLLSVHENPAALVAEIRLLVQQERIPEARERLQQLKKKHPGFEIPVDLKAFDAAEAAPK
jgi:hypothetical protein